MSHQGSPSPTASTPWTGTPCHSASASNSVARALGCRGLDSNLALSTANLFTAVQPGGSLYGLQHSNPVDVAKAYGWEVGNYGTARDPAVGKIVGGVNVFGGGLSLYQQKTAEVLGALGVSGDSSCADHVIAWRVRHALGFSRVQVGVNSGSYGGAKAPSGGDDNIIYAESGFRHPACGFGEAKVSDLPSMQNLVKPVAKAGK